VQLWWRWLELKLISSLARQSLQICQGTTDGPASTALDRSITRGSG
jgi:hypothetical protein